MVIDSLETKRNHSEDWRKGNVCIWVHGIWGTLVINIVRLCLEVGDWVETMFSSMTGKSICYIIILLRVSANSGAYPFVSPWEFMTLWSPAFPWFKCFMKLPYFPFIMSKKKKIKELIFHFTHSLKRKKNQVQLRKRNFYEA
jgi:hypothetical protein